VPPAESGLIVTGEAKSVAVLDLDGDGWPDFLVTRNNGATLAFRNSGIAGRHSLGVILRGPAGNPAAIGAHVTLELADGSTQSGEISAGSNQRFVAKAACFFGYTATNLPRHLRVRWPDGAGTVQDVPADQPVITVTAPSQ
jgi:hypothetical protein